MSCQIVNLEPKDFSNFYCPVCGRHLIGEDCIDDPCEHVLFIFVDSIGEFTHYDDSLREPVEKWIQDDDEFADKIEEDGKGIIDHLQQLVPETAVTISITTSGMACGPTWNTDFICINFDWEEK